MGQLNAKGVRTHAPYMSSVKFSFKVAGGAVTAIRQAKADIMDAVTGVARTATGRFTVTFKAGLPGMPRQLTYANVVVHGPDETPTSATLPCTGYVKALNIDTSASAYVIEVDTLTANGAAAQAVADPEDNSWVSVHIEGPMVDERKDAV